MYVFNVRVRVVGIRLNKQNFRRVLYNYCLIYFKLPKKRLFRNLIGFKVA